MMITALQKKPSSATDYKVIGLILDLPLIGLEFYFGLNTLENSLIYLLPKTIYNMAMILSLLSFWNV